MAMVNKNPGDGHLKEYNTPRYEGVTLALAHHYLGDDVSLDGVYYWNEQKSAISCDMVDDYIAYRMDRTVDASPDVCVKAQAFIQGEILDMLPRIEAACNGERASNILPGDKVRVIGGRKVKKGTEGTAFWVGDNGYGTSVGVALSDRKDSSGKYVDVAFVAYRFVELVNPPAMSLSTAQIAEILTKCGNMGSWDRLSQNVSSWVKHFLGGEKR